MLLSVEVFAAKDPEGKNLGVFLAAPVRCGLKQADSLRLDGLSLVAKKAGAILPLDLPNISELSRISLIEEAVKTNQIAVAEFTVLGLCDSYFLSLEVVA